MVALQKCDNHLVTKYIIVQIMGIKSTGWSMALADSIKEPWDQHYLFTIFEC
jgi:hypothetical protein